MLELPHVLLCQVGEGLVRAELVVLEHDPRGREGRRLQESAALRRDIRQFLKQLLLQLATGVVFLAGG